MSRPYQDFPARSAALRARERFVASRVKQDGEFREYLRLAAALIIGFALHAILARWGCAPWH